MSGRGRRQAAAISLFQRNNIVTMNAKLTPKQAAFVGEYLVDLNATRAGLRGLLQARRAADG